MPLPGRGPVTGRSSMNTDPLLVGSSPATIRKSVVFPQPLGPRTEMKLNSGNSMLMSLSAATPGDQCLVNSLDFVCINCLLTCSTLILARGLAGGCVESRARSGWTFKPYPAAIGLRKPVAAADWSIAFGGVKDGTRSVLCPGQDRAFESHSHLLGFQKTGRSGLERKREEEA